MEPERKGFPPLLYHSTDFELLTNEDVVQEMDWLADPEDYRR
ncbi:hypothetical protein [Myroides sp. LoEW2-1]|nr:hypothetical protein [Myroides sp. LoEW2-1]